MFHPNTRVYFINPIIGYGVFATGRIPKGTITFVPSFFVGSDLGYTTGDNIQHPMSLDPNTIMSELHLGSPLRFTYLWNNDWIITPNGTAMWVNHSCASNTLMTPYGYEIAVRDIEDGEEITTSYITRTCLGYMRCFCGSPNCVSMVVHADDVLVDYRNQQLLIGMECFNNVSQPLMSNVQEWIEKTGQDKTCKYSF